MKAPTIYAIKDAVEAKAPYFFSKNTLRTFGQTMGRFSIVHVDGAIFKISQAMKDSDGKHMGLTVRYFYKDDLYMSLEEAAAEQNKDQKGETV